jgi:hypothetical protein
VQVRQQLSDPRIRATVVASLAGLLVMLVMFVVLRRRARRRAEAAQWASMVEPSSDFHPTRDRRTDLSPSTTAPRNHVGSYR